MPSFTRLLLPAGLRDVVVEHARAELPNECCGLLAGLVVDGVGVASVRYAILNEAASPHAFLTNARDMLDASRAMRESRLELLAVYHSHPTSKAVPSLRDQKENTYGEHVVHLIVSLATAIPVLRGWWLGEETYREAQVLQE